MEPWHVGRLRGFFFWFCFGNLYADDLWWQVIYHWIYFKLTFAKKVCRKSRPVLQKSLWLDESSADQIQNGRIRLFYCRLRQYVPVWGFLLGDTVHQNVAKAGRDKHKHTLFLRFKSAAPFSVLLLMWKCRPVVIKLLLFQNPHSSS